jgi:hypothetical protein
MATGTLLAIIAAVALAVPPATSAQQDEPQEENKKSIKDYFDLYTYDPEELHEIWQEAEKRKQLLGPIGLGGYYIPSSQEPGPYYGPPLQIWGRGFGTSLWRNPITGWPIQ